MLLLMVKDGVDGCHDDLAPLPIISVWRINGKRPFLGCMGTVLCVLSSVAPKNGLIHINDLTLCVYVIQR